MINKKVLLLTIGITLTASSIISILSFYVFKMDIKALIILPIILIPSIKISEWVLKKKLQDV